MNLPSRRARRSGSRQAGARGSGLGRRIALTVPVAALVAVSSFIAPGYADDADGGDAPAQADTPAADPAPEPAPEPKPAPEPEPEPAPKDEEPPAEEPPAEEPPAEEAPAEESAPQEVPADAVPAGKEAKKGSNQVRQSIAALDVPINDKKVVICKYSATPEIGEKAQTVNIVSTSTLPANWVAGTFPASFSDAQGNTIAVRYAFEGENTNDVAGLLDELCPPYFPPGLVTAPTLTINDPCGPGNAAYGAVPPGPWTVETHPDGSITLTVVGNVLFLPEPGSTTKDYPAPIDSGEPCVVTPPAEPDPTDPCGLDNAYFADADIPESTAEYTVEVSDDKKTITITATPGNVFDEQGTTEVVYTAEDSGEPCVVTPPAEPDPTDPCGLDNAYFADADIPESTDAYTVEVSEDKKTITITATPGNVFDEQGTTEVVYTAEDSGEPCVVTPPAEPDPTDPCGLDNAYFADADIPESTDAYTVEVSEDKKTITITATPGNVFDEQGTTEVVYTATDSGEPCIGAVPAEPVPTDPCGLDNAYFADADVPESTDAYTVVLSEDKKTITITATPGNVFDEQGTTEVVYTAMDSDEPCVVEPAEPQQTDPCGLDNAFFADDEIPDSTDAYTVEVNDDNTVVTITATPGNVFDEEGTTELVFTAVDSGEPCVVEPPVAPEPVDACGPDNAVFADADVPESTEAYSVVLSEDRKTITVTATPGNAFDEEGTTELVFTAEDSGEACPVYVACVYAGADTARLGTGVPLGVVTIIDQATALANGFLGLFPFSYVSEGDEVVLITELQEGQTVDDFDPLEMCGEVAGICEDAATNPDAVDENGEPCTPEKGGEREDDPLPNTGGPDGFLLPLGALLVLVGAGLVMVRRPHSA